MSGFAGVRRVVRFNWPFYCLALLATAVAAWALATRALEPGARLAAVVALGLADGWLLASLLVSHLVYDRSGVARGDWLPDDAVHTVVALHLGHDEVAGAIARRLPRARRVVFDLHDPTRTGSPSLTRARAAAENPAWPASLDALPLANGSAELVVLAFAAHEVRDRTLRIALFAEVARVVGARGRAVVLEHLRDGWNALAYGPGVLHFLSRRTWLETFADAGLAVADESRLTPWVRSFRLVRS